MNELNKDRLELRKVKAIENVAKELRTLNDILKECKEPKGFEEKKIYFGILTYLHIVKY